MGKTGNENRRTGSFWEAQAAEFLQKKGDEILHRNFTSRFGEIDLVARQETYLVFVEVKYRKNDSGGHPLEAVGVQKQQRICRTADYYCLRCGYGGETPCRFDVVGIMGEEVFHIKDAFPYISGC